MEPAEKLSVTVTPAMARLIRDKVEDGSFRALAPAAAHVLGRLGVEGDGLGGLEVTNSHGEQVGELRVVT